MKKQLKLASGFFMIIGALLLIGGIWTLCFTQKSIKQENIITPQDASIPNKSVLGPWTLKSQSDIIRHHTLNITNGKTYAEMPRQIPKLDESGKEVLDNEGKPIMTDNTARNTWITATTLTTALHLAILSYGVSLLVILIGIAFIINGYILCLFSKKEN